MWIHRIALLALAIPIAATAQGLTGIVRDSLTGAPVRGAVVQLISAPNEPAVQTLTGSNGAFRVPVANANTLRVIRIGYQPWERPVAGLPAGSIEVRLVALGSRLPAVAVRANPVCPESRDARDALALWTAASDGLLALMVAADSAQATGAITQLLFDRLLDDAGRSIVRQSVDIVQTGNTAPVRAGRSPERLASDGYIESTATGATYYAPDAATLVDSSFAATHCLTIRPGNRDRRGQVGVAFTPARGRERIPDIAGVLWMQRTPLQLSAFEFEYRGVDQILIDARAGGTIEFETLANGTPVIRSWIMRTPRLAYVAGGRRVGRQTVADSRIPIIAERREAGGLLATGQWADGTTWSAPLATLAARVLDSRTNEPAAGVRVTLDSTDYTAASDSSGQVALLGVLPGPYVMRIADSVAMPRMLPDPQGGFFADTVIAQVVHRSATVPVEARLGRVAPVDLRLPWGMRVGGCFGYDEGAPRYVLLGRVTAADSVSLGAAAVRVSWQDRDRATTIETAVEARTTADGRLWLCGLPADRVLQAIVIDAAGQTYVGTTSVPSVEIGEDGLPRRSNVRRIAIVVDRVTGAGGSP